MIQAHQIAKKEELLIQKIDICYSHHIKLLNTMYKQTDQLKKFNTSLRDGKIFFDSLIF